jgi:hypothetical protein
MLIFQFRNFGCTGCLFSFKHIDVVWGNQFWDYPTNVQYLIHRCQTLVSHTQNHKALFFICNLQGPLFQQRPYPSPGAVLRRNAEVATPGNKKRGGMAPISKRGDGSDGLGEAD